MILLLIYLLQQQLCIQSLCIGSQIRNRGIFTGINQISIVIYNERVSLRNCIYGIDNALKQIDVYIENENSYILQCAYRVNRTKNTKDLFMDIRVGADRMSALNDRRCSGIFTHGSPFG
ncbi:hypothetical protein D3C76_1039130 [compost metagenome]